MKRAYVFLADGFEEVEAIAPIDVMRRAGIDVTTVSVDNDGIVIGAHGVALVADATIGEVDCQNADVLVLPGGMPGASNLAACELLNQALQAHGRAGKTVAAICASPAVVLAPLGLLDGRDATCYPSFEPPCEAAGAKMLNQRVVKSGNIITSNGPSSALPFAFAIVSEIVGGDVANDVASGMLVNM